MPEALTSALAGKKLLLVGCGKMGTALLRGWLDAGLSPEQFLVQEPNADEALKSLGVTLNPTMGADIAPDIMLLAVKPQIIGDVLPSLADAVSNKTMIVSLMAGISIVEMARLLGDNAADSAFVRTMPNTPAAIGEGMTALYADANTNDTQRAAAEALLSAVGKTVWLSEEKQIDAVTAISGSGPAYVFHLVEALQAAATNLALPSDMATDLAMQTVIGAAAMLRDENADPQQLRVNVTSPGGTTAAALDVLMSENGLGDLMRRATQAAAHRAAELGRPKDDD
jgi:pyrroline-5-carboxylate reductase